MQELTTTATLVEYGTLEGGRSITAVLPRSQVAAALHGDDSAQLWFELGREGHEETRRLTVDVASADVEELLRLSSGDEVVLALDGDTLAGVFDDPDVEAHGMRAALAIAVTTAAIAAPAGLAATPQNVGAAATPQVSAQVASPATTAQVAGLGVSAQVSRQVTPAAVAQVRAQVAKAQISKTLVVKAAGVKLLRSGFAR